VWPKTNEIMVTASAHILIIAIIGFVRKATTVSAGTRVESDDHYSLSKFVSKAILDHHHTQSYKWIIRSLSHGQEMSAIALHVRNYETLTNGKSGTKRKVEILIGRVPPAKETSEMLMLESSCPVTIG